MICAAGHRLLIFLVAAVGTSYGAGVADIPAGDLLFLQPPLSASSPLDSAIQATGMATISWLRTHGVSIPEKAANDTATHVAISWHAPNGSRFFVQALPQVGVVATPAAEFALEIPPRTTIYRGTVVSVHATGLRVGIVHNTTRPAFAGSIAEAAARVALAQVGKPYAADFEQPPHKFYCSSLVEYAYQQAMRQKAVFLDQPFSLIFVPKSFWTSWYASLDPPQAVPTNVTGSNPTLLLHSPAVHTSSPL
jgi:hypothetical protein